MTGLWGLWPIWGYEVSDQTVGNVLQRHGLPPAPERKHTTTWATFIRAHLAVLAGDRLFHGGGPHAARTGDLLRAVFHPSREPQGGHRRDHRPPERAVDAANGPERDHGGMRHPSGLSLSRAIIESGGVKTLPLPARSPNLNAYAERWVKSVKDECLSKIILFGERSLRRALSEYVEHYHAERNHQGKSNVLLFRRVTQTRREEPVQCRERLGGILNYYHQEAA